MAGGITEARIKKLESTIERMVDVNEQQAKRIQRLEDAREIANMMGRYVYMHEVQKDPEFYKTMFAKKTPGVSWEVAHMGVFKGRKGIKRALDAHGPQNGNKPAPGTLFLHTLVTPVIEVAADGKTAKGLWTSPGAESLGSKGYWAWTKYGCDFVKEDGKWKIWHYHVYRIFMTPVGMDFNDEYEIRVIDSDRKKKGKPVLPGLVPDAPPTYDNPFSKKYIPELIPTPPEPYETWDPNKSYGPQE